MYRVETNETGKTVFVCGQGGVARYDQIDENPFVLTAKRDAPHTCQIKSSRFAPYPLLAQEATSNHIVCLDKVLVPLSTVEEGFKDETEGRDV
jgi:hypothetical protein